MIVGPLYNPHDDGNNPMSASSAKSVPSMDEYGWVKIPIQFNTTKGMDKPKNDDSVDRRANEVDAEQWKSRSPESLWEPVAALLCRGEKDLGIMGSPTTGQQTRQPTRPVYLYAKRHGSHVRVR